MTKQLLFILGQLIINISVNFIIFCKSLLLRNIKLKNTLFILFVYSRVSQTFLQMAPFKEIEKAMAPFNKITHKLR